MPLEPTTESDRPLANEAGAVEPERMPPPRSSAGNELPSRAPEVRLRTRLGTRGHEHDAATISPRMTAVFGGLFGLATVASIFALLIQVFPVERQARVTPTAAPSANDGSEPSSAGALPGAPKRERKLLPSPWRVGELSATHKVVQGEMKRRSFLVALEEAKIPKSEAYRVLKAMEGVYKLEQPKRRDKFAIALERATQKIVAFEYEVSPIEIYQARTNDAGLLEGKRLDLAVRQEEFAAAAYLGKDLASSFEAAGFAPGLSSVVNEAFNGQTSVEAFEEGGVLRAIVVETTALGRFVKYERVRALEYRPPEPGKPPLRAYWFEGSGVQGYTDERGRRPSNQGWRTPCPGSPVTSHFNPKRLHPVLKKVMPHNGTDFGAPLGTPVYAAFRGKVSFIGNQGASGNLVLLEHSGAIQTGYAHLSRFAPGIHVGDQVGTRELIGYVGSTGRSTGPHLHFSAKRDGKFFDALDLRLDALHLLPTDERGAFLAQKQALDQALEAIVLPEPPPPPPVAVGSAEPAAIEPGHAAAGTTASPHEPTGSESAEAGEPGSDAGSSDDRGSDDRGKAAPSGAPAGHELLGEDLSGEID